MIRFGFGFVAVLGLVVAAAAEEAPEAKCVDDEAQRRDFVVVESFSENLQHISMEGVSDVPADGVSVEVKCTIDNDGRFAACRAGCNDAKAAPFVAVALKRAAAVRVETKSRGGNSLIGVTVMAGFKIFPEDRLKVASVDFTRGDQLVFASVPTKDDLLRVYPSSAAESEVEAMVDMACVVQEDLSVQCPHGVVFSRGERWIDPFEKAAKRVITHFRLAPQTKDGKSPVGIWFRRKVRFVLS